MKIAQIAPLYESVPPKLYGGTERIVHYLTDELVNLGNEVTLFASGDSTTKANLVSNVDQALRLNKSCIDPLAHHIVQMQEVIDRVQEFDILHFHTDYLHFPFTSQLAVPCITTLHGRLDIPELKSIYNKFPNQKLVSISNDQRRPLPQANFIGTVYHGLPVNLHRPGNGNEDYLAFLGRISPEKRVDRAIEIAIASKSPIKIAAKIDKVDEAYFESQIKPLLDHPLVEFIGEINEEQKTAFLGKARALLFPIDWAEPFGLVMIEAMACGIPVIAYKNGSVPEVIDEGKSGFIVGSIDEAVEAVLKSDQLPRWLVRKTFEDRFTASRMAKDYLKIYSSVIQHNQDNEKGKLKALQGKPYLYEEEKKKIFRQNSLKLKYAGRRNGSYRRDDI